MKDYDNDEKCMEIDEKKVAWKVLKIIGFVILGLAVCVLAGFVNNVAVELAHAHDIRTCQNNILAGGGLVHTV